MAKTRTRIDPSVKALIRAAEAGAAQQLESASTAVRSEVLHAHTSLHEVEGPHNALAWWVKPGILMVEFAGDFTPEAHRALLDLVHAEAKRYPRPVDIILDLRLANLCMTCLQWFHAAMEVGARGLPARHLILTIEDSARLKRLIVHNYGRPASLHGATCLVCHQISVAIDYSTLKQEEQ